MLVILILSCGAVFAKDDSYSEWSAWDQEGWNASPIIREACSGIQRWYLCAAAAESAFLALNPTITHELGILRIPLRNGKKLDFTDRVETGGYTYLGMISPLPYHLVLFSYEETHYTLVNADTGWQTHAYAFPVVSPNNRLVATARPDFRGDLENAIRIWSVESDTLLQVFLLDGHEVAHPDTSINGWGPEHPAWIGSDTLRCDVFCSTKDGGRVDQVIDVWRSAKGWAYAFSDVSK
jgi:hypothetical protein